MLDPAHEINFGPYTLSGFIAELQGNVEHLIGVFTGQDDLWTQSYLGSMLRQMVVALAGAGLALCGAVYQGAFRNALLAPSTLGVMSGAQFGLMIWVVLFGVTTDRPWFRKFFTEVDHVQATFITEHKFYVQAEGVDTGLYYLWDSLSLALFSFAGCVLVVALVLLTMRLSKRVRTSAIMLIITGQMIGGVTGAVYSTVRYYYIVTDPWGMKAGLLTELQISSFYRNFSWIDIVCIGLPLLVTFLVVMKLRQKMMLLSFDEGESRTMGTDVRRMQIIIVGLCTLLTAIIVSFCGAVGFVGFLVPHLTRRLVGPNFRYLLPATTVFGAVFVLGAYMLLAMTMGTGYQTMLGMYISIGGAIIFLATALRGKGVAYGGFR
ncbi:MAG: iron ABC transporter permease [Clostridiales Family XIII bacterium]|nr:iron ABC transporter permease [Clostridiales Family XIII bacterium]